jgi:hypothetical protein
MQLARLTLDLYAGAGGMGEGYRVPVALARSQARFRK